VFAWINSFLLNVARGGKIEQLGIHMCACIFQYKMVKEALEERANLLEIAPHLSAPLPIMLPVYK